MLFCNLCFTRQLIHFQNLISSQLNTNCAKSQWFWYNSFIILFIEFFLQIFLIIGISKTKISIRWILQTSALASIISFLSLASQRLEVLDSSLEKTYLTSYHERDHLGAINKGVESLWLKLKTSIEPKILSVELSMNILTIIPLLYQHLNQSLSKLQ